MKAIRPGLAPLVALVLTFSFQAAHADVRSQWSHQSLTAPSAYEHLVGVAIDGGHVIVLGIDEAEGGNVYAALLYRRNLGNGQWEFRRTLANVTGFFVRSDVSMANGLAAVNFGGNVFLFEYSGGDYVPAPSTGPIRHPGGVAISGSSVIVGGDNCDYDAVIYQKGTDGNWGITGRLDDNIGECDAEGVEVDLSYDYALVKKRYTGVANVWRRNGSALEWIPAGSLSIPPESPVSEKPFTLQRATAVSSGGHVFRRGGTSTWNYQGKATSVDIDNSHGVTFEAQYRDGLLLTSESGKYQPFPRLYAETTPGQFEHLASLFTSRNPSHVDISGRTVVAVTRSAIGGDFEVEIFTLPAELRVPTPIVNDFEDGDASEFSFNSAQFSLATRGTDDVLAQNTNTGMAIALVNDSDWPEYQRVEAEIKPTFATPDSWVGLITRYADSGNFYFAFVRGNQTYGIYKRVNGVNTLLREGTYYAPTPGYVPSRLALVMEGDQLWLRFDTENYPPVTDSSLTHGRAGLATWRSRADFDNVHVAAAPEYALYSRDHSVTGSDYDFDMIIEGGTWRLLEEDGYLMGVQQQDASVSAVARIGAPVRNQSILTRVKLDSFGSSSQGAWFGLLARYVDPQNHYYVTFRSTGQVQIRKQVNGVITVLASANFSPVPNQYYDVEFIAINDQLHLYVDHALVASAHDDAIPSGQYALATYRATATWETIHVQQP